MCKFNNLFEPHGCSHAFESVSCTEQNIHLLRIFRILFERQQGIVHFFNVSIRLGPEDAHILRHVHYFACLL
ncbi:hypothetical protein SDC9_102269 [bioreactor metagenome]|uniref:Uncharacterized protein n=1 Tax=bioreactor metagenome TaxID=1076179 RepID=A0A645AQD2_9ZZZZ